MDLSTSEHLQIADHLLTTTRSVRKRLDLERPVEPEVIERCIELAIQAPSGGNRQGWHFLVVTDAELRREIGELYRRSFQIYRQEPAAAEEQERPDRPSTRQRRRVAVSANYLAESMGQVPVLILPCIEGRVDGAPAMTQAAFYGSILPATWSLMLALRARGLGSAWTTLHLRYAAEVAGLLDIPDDVTQAALLPVAYFTGDDFKPARRLPARERTYWDGWGRRRHSPPS